MENGRWKCALKGTLLIAIVIPAVMLLISVISGGLGVVLYAILEKNMHLYVDCCLFLLYNERKACLETWMLFLHFMDFPNTTLQFGVTTHIPICIYMAMAIT